MEPYAFLEEALAGLEIPSEIREALRLTNVRHFSFDGSVHSGQLVLHKDLTEDIQAIFDSLTEYKFPIRKVVPIVAYGWDDEASMEDNNTSAFNYRPATVLKILSNHAYGRAVDINPLQNPLFGQDGKIYPAHTVYDPLVPGTITKDSEIVKVFKSHGWEWLGDRDPYPDYQHFQKLI